MSEENYGNSSGRKLIEVILERISTKKLFYSIEVTPSDPPLNLASLEPPPLFASITWITDKNLIAFRENPSACPALEMAKELQKKSIPVLSHLTCFNMTSRDLEGILQVGQLESIFALRGDASGASPEFRYAANLVEWLRRKLPDATIAVAGYPDTHFLSASPEDDLRRLREKVDAGADLIITQVNFSANRVIDFLRKCRSTGITANILPGLLIPPNFQSLHTVTKLGRIVLEEDLWRRFKEKKNDEEGFQELVLEVAETWMRELLEKCPEDFCGFHIFTWNDLEMTKKLTKRFPFV